MTIERSEYPESVVKDISGKHFNMALDVRAKTGVPMIPSPNPDAHVRYVEYNPTVRGMGSRHRVCDGLGEVIRQSDAGDYFLVKNSDTSQFWLKAQRSNDLGGFGLYFDTHLGGEKRVMCHLDNRPKRTLWICPDQEKREYVYFNADPARYFEVLAEELRKL